MADNLLFNIDELDSLAIGGSEKTSGEGSVSTDGMGCLDALLPESKSSAGQGTSDKPSVSPAVAIPTGTDTCTDILDESILPPNTRKKDFIFLGVNEDVYRSGETVTGMIVVAAQGEHERTQPSRIEVTVSGLEVTSWYELSMTDVKVRLIQTI